MSGIANDSRFSKTSNYFVPVATEAGGSALDSTVVINPAVGLTSSGIVNNVPVGGILNLGSSIAHPNTIELVETAPPGKGYVVITGDNQAGSVGLTLAGGNNGVPAGLINMGSNTGDESLTIGANATSSYNNIILTAGNTSFNQQVSTALDVDITIGGTLRNSYPAGPGSNQAQAVPCPFTSSGDVANFTSPSNLLPGLYAVTISAGADNRAYAAYYASGLLYWNGAQWTSGGFNCNPGVLNGFGVRLLNNSPGAQLTFCHGSPTPPTIGVGGVNINFRLLMSGPNFATQLPPFT